MTEQIEVPQPPSIEAVVNEWQGHWAQSVEQGTAVPPAMQTLPGPVLADLRARLIGRDEALADTLRLRGTEYGLLPQVVAKVLMDAGLGEPKSEEQRAYVQREYDILIQHLRDEHGFPG
jgi:hypothetical protein